MPEVKRINATRIELSPKEVEEAIRDYLYRSNHTTDRGAGVISFDIGFEEAAPGSWSTETRVFKGAAIRYGDGYYK
jgi:hypothetical protein